MLASGYYHIFFTIHDRFIYQDLYKKRRKFKSMKAIIVIQKEYSKILEVV